MGGTYLAIALGLQSIPPLLLIGARSILGGAVLLGFSQLRRLTPRSREDWWHAAISGALLFIGCHGTLAYAQRYVPSGLSAIFLATIPFWIVLVNVSTGQSEALRRLLALVPGLAGVALIAWNETSNTPNSLPLGVILLLLVSSLSWALGSVYVQRRAAHIPPHDLAGMQLICGSVGLLMLSHLVGEWIDLPEGDAAADYRQEAREGNGGEEALRQAAQVGIEQFAAAVTRSAPRQPSGRVCLKWNPLGVNLLATVRTSASHVSSAIFWASMTSPIGRAPIGMKHNPSCRRPLWSTSHTFTEAPAWILYRFRLSLPMTSK
jgi:hypothetical protein